jgi:DNA-binding transcriptional MerR regulator
MFSIGEFARHGRVSVRMLRHYDAVGLLQPAHVDRLTSYRSYEAEQLSRLNRIVALKELGFTLQQVQSILDDKVSLEELHGMLRLRQADLQTQIAADTARLTQVRTRLEIIEREGVMPTEDITIKRIPAVRVAEVTGCAAGFEPASITPVIGPLYDELCRRLDRAGIVPTGPGVAHYQDGPDGDVLVHAGLPVNAEPAEGQDFSIVDLPEITRAATIVHRGSMDSVLTSVQALARWIDANGYRSAGYNRELYIETGADRESWVTELQEPLADVFVNDSGRADG